MAGAAKGFWLRFFFTGVFVCLLALSPAVHSYLHPYEVTQASTCHTTGFTLSLDCPEGPVRLPGIPDAAQRLSGLHRESAHSLLQASFHFTRGPPVSLSA
jgi:hypothetical protein